LVLFNLLTNMTICFYNNK